MLNKEKTEVETSTSQHQEESERDDGHVSKIERRLEQATHSTSVEVIEERVCVDEETSHSCVDESTPPPSMIFSGQLKVQQGHTDERGHDEKKDERKEKDSKQSVHLMSPHGGKDVMKFNVNCRKGQESRNEHLHEASTIPGNFSWDFASHLGGAGGRIEIVTGIVLSQNTTQHGQGQGDQSVDKRDGKDGRKWQCTSRSMGQGNRVYPHKNKGDREREQSSRVENTTDPGLAPHLKVKSGRNKATNRACQAVEYDHPGEDGSTTSGGDEVGQCQDEEGEGGDCELRSGAYGGTKEYGELGETEHVAMN